MGYVYCAPHDGSNKITLEGFDHLTWRYKIIPYIRTDNCTDMSNMFSGAGYMLPASLDLRNFNTSNVTTMRSMFDNCMSQTILGLDNFDTSKVTDMAFMFNGSKAVSLNLSGFDTSKVTDMENMFCNCEVTNLNINGFDTSLVTNMSGMFENVGVSIDVSNFDTSEVTTMHNMFKGTAGTELDLSNFDTSSVTDMSGMFQNAAYDEIDTSSFDTSSVTNMADMFRLMAGVNGVDELDLSNFDFSNVTDMSYMFGYNNLTSLTLPQNIDISNVENIKGLFYYLQTPSLDLRGYNFESATNQINLFCGLQTNVLDISDWDLGAHSSYEPHSQYSWSDYAFGVNEYLFYNAHIGDLRLSNSNTFPEGYNIQSMFQGFQTNGTLDLSTFHFNKATSNNRAMFFTSARINTLIMCDMTTNEFNFENYSDMTFFNNAVINLLDMSNRTLSLRWGTKILDGLTATRINMPNIIPYHSNWLYDYSSTAKAKYVDYSSVDTTNVNFNDYQWNAMSQMVTLYNKVVWIPSTFVLNGNYSMSDKLQGDVYTDALDYTDLGWKEEPANVIMHYGTTHADFEQAILNDDPDEWVSPNGRLMMFCHKSVPLNSRITINQFDGDYSEVYYDDTLIDLSNFTFTQTGTHTLKVIYNDYEYKQKITVVNHGSNYNVVGTPYDYIYNASTRQYTKTNSTCVECRLYTNDKYLFIYPIGKVQNTYNIKFTAIESAPDTTIRKISGVPFEINQLNLKNCTQLTDISELIISTGFQNSTRGFNPSEMFNGCTSLSNVSSIDKWRFTTTGNEVNGNFEYSYYKMFYGTHITSAPKISIKSGSSHVFANCLYLTDISKLGKFFKDTYNNYSTHSFHGMFEGCSRLVNVSRLKYCLSAFCYQPNSTNNGIGLSYFLRHTAITNTDFIPDNLLVGEINYMFDSCFSLTDLSGLSRICRLFTTFSNTFYYVPATDYSYLSAWKNGMNGYVGRLFTSVDFTRTSITNLSFMSEWPLSNCTEYKFLGCQRLTSISGLSGAISTTKEVKIDLKQCPALTSLVGLEGSILGKSEAFQNCTSLTSLNGLQGCTIKNATSLFYGCSALTDITALSQVTFDCPNINYMLQGCSSLTSLNGLQSVNTSSMTELISVFRGCSALTDISAMADWNLGHITNIYHLFNGCSSLTSLAALSNCATDILENATEAFSSCTSLQSLNGIRWFNPGLCTSLSNMFYNCTSLTDISAIQYWVVSNCTNLSYMFYGCTSLLSIAPLASWNVVKLTNMTSMFNGDIAITDADSIESWSTKCTIANVSKNSAFRNVPTPWPTWAVS